MSLDHAKQRLDGIMASDLKLRDAALEPWNRGRSFPLPKTETRQRSSSVFGAAWAAAHNIMATPESC